MRNLAFDLDSLFEFVRSRPFDAAWKAARLGDDDLRRLEWLISEAPDKAPLIEGSGGLRKLRIAIRPNEGKRGGASIGYAYFRKYGVVLLAACYVKNVQENITSEQKKAIKALLTAFEDYLEKREER